MNIGNNTENGKTFNIDINNLIETRMLITANSGAGKSFTIRKIVEESHSKVQQIILDLEGEFSTLREKYDFILIGKEGELQAEIRTAEILAKKLLELKTSAIIDLSELEFHQRITFVKRFLDSMIGASKELWHQVMVIIDEAHHFAPESGKCESASSVIDLMTRGRKRGFCGILATQRISKLSKDACAEANNKLIGRACLDIDMKRASEELGFTSKEDTRKLRDMEAGEFYAFGPSMDKGISKIKIDQVETTHVRVGKNQKIKVAPPSEEIKAILQKITDIPKEAENEIKTKQDLLDKIRKLNGELSNLRMQQGRPKIDEKSLKTAEEKGYERGNKETGLKWQNSIAPLANETIILRKQLNKMIEDANVMSGSKVFNIISELKDKIAKCSKSLRTTTKGEANVEQLQERGTNALYQRNKNTTGTVADAGSNPALATYSQNDTKIGRCERLIYTFLYSYQNRTFSKEQVGSVTGYSCNSGGFNNALGKMNALGLIKRVNGRLQVNEINPEIVEQGLDFSINNINNILGKCEKEIFKVLKDNPQTEYKKEDLAAETPTNYSPNSGGFNNSLGRLNTLGLIKRNNGTIRLNQELMEI